MKDLSLSYDAVNEDDTFSEGDTVTGRVTLELDKPTKVESLFVKAKGDATVRWTVQSGDNSYAHTADRRFFKLKEFLIPERENSKETVLPHGIHVYKFSIKIPAGSMPSSFRGAHGKIVYSLEAKLARSWRMDKTAEKELNFVSKSIPNIDHLMSRQVGSTDKEMGSFPRGQVHMDVSVDRTAYSPGEKVSIVAKVNNASSKDMTPKFSLKQKAVFHAKDYTKEKESVICKMFGDVIVPNTERTFMCAMDIPANLPPTIHNCEIISLEYQLKVYLDISFTSDPEVTFPFVIVPVGFRPFPQPGGAMGPVYPPAGWPSSSDFPPTAVPVGPYPASSAPAAYGYPAAPGPGSSGDFPGYPPLSTTYSFQPPEYPGQPATYPGQPPEYPGQPPEYPGQPSATGGGGYSNPLTQQRSPYGFPSSSSSTVNDPPPPTALMFQPPPPSAPVFHPPPTAPTYNPPPAAPTYNLPPAAPTYMDSMDFLSQPNEPPPSYTSLFSPSVPDVTVPTGSDDDKKEM